jgi:hypothetical protein
MSKPPTTRFLYEGLLREAERARWRFEDIQWADIKGDAVDDVLIELVRKTISAELTTFSATQRFMDAYSHDIDFSQWISVWFYEETKHPAVLMRWLAHVRVEVDEDELLSQRETFPFTTCALTTLALNVIAEMQAADAYLALAAFSQEPVLSQICTRIAGDEARHATHFFRYAQHLRSVSDDPDRQARRVLTTLLTWLTAQSRLQHPGQIALTSARSAVPSSPSPLRPIEIPLQERVCSVVGRLLSIENLRVADVRGVLVRMPRGKSIRNRLPSAVTSH